MARAHCRIKVPSESRVVGELIEYSMEADSSGAYTTLVGINPALLKKTLASTDFEESFHANCRKTPRNQVITFVEGDVHLHGSKSNFLGSMLFLHRSNFT